MWNDMSYIFAVNWCGYDKCYFGGENTLCLNENVPAMKHIQLNPTFKETGY